MRIQTMVKSGIFSGSLIIVLGVISVCFGYVDQLQHELENSGVTTVPHVFYSALNVTKIDQVGNVQGITSIYRVDGMNGRPKRIAVLPGETFQQAIQFQDKTLQYEVVASNDLDSSKFIVTLDGQGDDISSFVKNTGARNSKDAVLTQSQWIHPQGTYATTSEIFCTDTPIEGPCTQSYRITITDLATNQKKVVSPKDFGGLDGQWFARPLVEITSSSALVSLEAMQERLTAFVGILNFSTGTIQPLQVIDKNYQGEIAGKNYLRLSDDSKSAYFIDWIGTESQQPAIVAMELSTGEFSTITTNIPGATFYWPKNTNTILYGNPGGTRVVRRNIQTGDETIVAQTSLDEYLHPVRFSTKTTSSSTGVEGGKLMMIDRLTGLQRVIFDQLQESNAYGPNVNGGASSKNAKIGSIIYQFVGIDQ